MLFCLNVRTQLPQSQFSCSSYSVFQGFGQTKFAYGDSILGSCQFFATAPAAFKNDTHY
jgi:hypothetical protein